MNKFSEAVEATQNQARTFNDAATNYSSLDACLDLFFIIGTRDGNYNSQFELAWQQNYDMAARIALWARDARGGSGERKTFRNVLKYMEQAHPNELLKLLPKIPEVGRWDDLLIFNDGPVKTAAYSLIEKALKVDRNGLCAKWMPREKQAPSKAYRYKVNPYRTPKEKSASGTLSAGKKKNAVLATELRKFMSLSSRDYRHLLSSLSKVVETDMCAKKWDQINYNHVPSLASARYQKAFNKHDSARYATWKEGLKTGETKVNAATLFPYDCMKAVNNGDQVVAQAQWDALPNYIKEGERIIPMCDVSGSMTAWGYYGQRAAPKITVSPMDICVSLGLYVADKQDGAFKDLVLTFSGQPEILKLTGNLITKMNKLKSATWGMNTNICAAFTKILKLAVQNNVPNDEMPTMLLVLSDMEFDSCVHHDQTAFKFAQQEFEAAGYSLPKIVFWCLNSRVGNVPVTFKQDGTALVSGFSPAILKSVLAVEAFNPETVMLQAIMQDRYKIDW